jgi:hypothetical protein
MADVAGMQHEFGRCGQTVAAFSVPATSVLAGLLNPMWLSLICTKLNSPAPAALLPIWDI